MRTWRVTYVDGAVMTIKAEHYANAWYRAGHLSKIEIDSIVLVDAS